MQGCQWDILGSRALCFVQLRIDTLPCNNQHGSPGNTSVPLPARPPSSMIQSTKSTRLAFVVPGWLNMFLLLFESRSCHIAQAGSELQFSCLTLYMLGLKMYTTTTLDRDWVFFYFFIFLIWWFLFMYMNVCLHLTSLVSVTPEEGIGCPWN